MAHTHKDISFVEEATQCDTCHFSQVCPMDLPSTKLTCSEGDAEAAPTLP